MSLNVNDIVCYRASFLRSISWFTNVPINGKVVEAADDSPRRVRVEWSDGTNTVVLESNLILESKKHLEPV